MKPIARVIFSGAGSVGVAVGWEGPQPLKAMITKHSNELRIKLIVFLMQTSERLSKANVDGIIKTETIAFELSIWLIEGMNT
jgi:hypothetical protein